MLNEPAVLCGKHRLLLIYGAPCPLGTCGTRRAPRVSPPPSRGRRRVARRRGRCGTSRAMPSTAAPLFRPWRLGPRRKRRELLRRSRGRPRTRCHARPRRRCPIGRANTRRGSGAWRLSRRAALGCGVCPRPGLSLGILSGGNPCVWRCQAARLQHAPILCHWTRSSRLCRGHRAVYGARPLQRQRPGAPGSSIPPARPLRTARTS